MPLPATDSPLSPEQHDSSVRIAVLLAQLRGAGIQRMRFNIIKRLLALGYQVDLVVGQAKGELVERIPAGATLHAIGKGGVMGVPIGLLHYLRKHRPTHVMSSYEDLSIMLLLAKKLSFTDTFTLVSTHNAISQLVHEGNWLNRMKQKLIKPVMKYLYPGANSLVAVSRGVAQELNAYLGLPLSSIEVIYNPVITEEFAQHLNRPDAVSLSDQLSGPVVGFFGRLHEQKRVDLLIEAFSKLRKVMTCTLLIVGEGVERERLEVQVAELGIKNDVCFFGFSDSPYALMKRCRVVVLPSDYEGLGNVLIEAMACGTQVISTDCPHGPREILMDGELGQLVPVGDVDGLSAAMRSAVEGDFHVDGARLVARAMEFSAGTATSKYLKAMRLDEARAD